MISLTLTVQMQSALHIGGETRQNTDAALPMLKTPDGFPYIPATSIKGRLRDEVERLLRRLNHYVCTSPRPEHMCRPIGDQPLCAVCALFGSPWHEASLYFQDLTLNHNQRSLIGSKTPSTTPRMSVRINRKRRVAQDNFLFDIELFQPGYSWEFTGQLTYTGDNMADLAPLLLASKGVTMLGKARSRGLGWCSVHIGDEQSQDTDNLRVLWKTWSGG